MNDCVFPTGMDRLCGNPGDKLKVVIGDRALSGAYCSKHTDDVIGSLTLLGMELMALTGRKRRALYEAESGALFSMAEAREWAIEQGMREANGRTRARITNDELAAYAAAH